MTNRRAFLKSSLAALATTAVGVTVPPLRAAEENILDIGSEKQLLLDDWIIAENKGLKRTLHRPTKQGLCKEADGSDWDRGDTYVGHIVSRDSRGRFHMTYRYEWWDAAVRDLLPQSNFDKAHWFREATAYATSDDGIHWHKPALGLIDGPTGIRKIKQFPFEEPVGISKRNNLGCPFDFIYDLHAHGNVHEKEKRFLLRLVERDDTHVFAKAQHSALYYAADWPDFVNDANWKEKLTPLPGAVLSPRARNDHKTLCGYDHQAGVWFSTHQGHIGDWIKRGGRDIDRYTSPDLQEWNGPDLVLPIAADESKRVDDWVEYMYLDAYRVGGERSGAWLGQLTVFHGDRSNPEYQWPQGDGVWRKGLDDVRLVISRDAGRTWQRIAGKQAWLTHGPKPHSYDRLIYNTKEPVRVGDELWFYYPAYDGDHLIFNRDGSLYEPGFIRTTRTARATMRLDGYVSLDAIGTTREMSTKLLRFRGDSLFVNVDAPQGVLQAELLDPTGRPIREFTLADSEPVTGDGVKQPLRWRGGNLKQFSGQPVSLRFKLTQGALYSFQFESTEKS